MSFPPDRSLTTPLQFLKGVGPDRAKLLEKLGLRTVEELLWNLPRDVIDMTQVTPIPELQADEFHTVRGVVADRDSTEISGNRSMTSVLLESDRHYVRGVWFNQPWMLAKFREGQTVLFTAKPKRRGGRWEFNNPRVQWLHDDDPGTDGGVLPRYSLTDGLTMDQLRRILDVAVGEFSDLIEDPLPGSFLKAHHLTPLREAISNLHFPNTKTEYEAARRRLIFDDLLEFQLAIELRRLAWWQQSEAPPLPTTAKIDARIRRRFPFPLTSGQNRAVREIAADLAAHRPMHRLLQADVGAGKTVVAVYALLVAVAAGYQGVLMAPTEVLALQHWATVQQILAGSRVRMELLTGSRTAAERERIRNSLRQGAIDLTIGTQALVQDGVEFANLGLIVIDEQHKFGVRQRSRFQSANALAPHVLVMTATPIPRSLCLTQYGDLDVSLISERPPGRQTVTTSLLRTAHQRTRAWEFLHKQLSAGRQAFIICPRVSASEDSEPDDESTQLPKSVEEVYADLSQTELKDVSVAWVHGRMNREEQTATMMRFRNGDIQALIATTVVEVGVDVPNASLMVVYNADRFGLSQLHQLRGRIGRGKHPGYCFLLSDTDNEDSLDRLTALEKTADGFQIAEFDFDLRGPGDVLGTQQHGDLPLRVANIKRDAKLLLEARQAAQELLKTNQWDAPEFANLKSQVQKRFGHAFDSNRTG